MKHTKGYITVCKHNSGAEPHIRHFKDKQDAVNEIHNFFLSYDFELKSGKPYDDGNDDGNGGDSDNGFDCFDEYKKYKGKICSFMHCSGDGPIAYFEKT